MFLSVEETPPPAGNPKVEPFDEPPPSPPQPVCLDVNVVPEHEQHQLQASISVLQEQISELKSKQRHLDGKRREALNKLLDIKGSIRVFCRLRPPLPAAKGTNFCSVTTESEKITIRSAGARKEFRVDRVFPAEAAQEDVFSEVEPILRSALDGHNVCVFAYGQTGTGKTYSMEGTAHQPGIVPRAIKELFRQASEDGRTPFSFSMSMLEVYLGSLKDLLAQRASSGRNAELLSRSLNIQTGADGHVNVDGLTKVDLDDYKQACHWYARGKRARTTSWTNVNEASSRSHCLTRITISRPGHDGKEEETVSKLWMVDLGGSERLLKTGATGHTMDEGKAINLSLSALGDVISAQKRKKHHVPYRNSKLTQILKDSLGDGSKVLMLVHISSSENDIGESICSLNFAKRARAIESNEEVTEELKRHKENRLIELHQLIKDAEEELQDIGNHIQKAELHLYDKKKLLKKGYEFDDQKGSPRSPLIIGCEDISGSPHTNCKNVFKSNSRSLPRFMTSTVCSRHRQSAAAEMGGSRFKETRLGSMSTFDLFGSQSHSFMDSRSRLGPHNPRNITAKYETTKTRFKNVPLLGKQESVCLSSVDSKSSIMPRSRKVCSSQPILRVAMCHHRRRMSDLI